MGVNRIHPSIFLALHAIMIPCLLKGKERIRSPDAENIAFVKAGAARGTAGSPTPPISLLLSIISTDIFGEPFNLSIE